MMFPTTVRLYSYVCMYCSTASHQTQSLDDLLGHSGGPDLCPLCLTFLQAFDMQRDLQITPRRLEYTREKEGELFNSLMAIANRKQEEMKEMIVETLTSMKEQLLEDAANLEFTGEQISTGANRQA